MIKLSDYQLFLFDLDGLLVNTEEIHFLAYKKMCKNRGVNLNWNFDDFCRVAHYSSEKIRQKICMEHPEILAQVSAWEVLYAEKKQAVVDLFKAGNVKLMPGVESFLLRLQKADITRCVVTNSSLEMINSLRYTIPLLQTIPHWVTREDYVHPKPNPECYLKAIEMFAKPTDRVIGFEDTPRGITALLETRATSVMICQENYPEIPWLISKGILRFSSFDEVFYG